MPNRYANSYYCVLLMPSAVNFNWQNKIENCVLMDKL